LIVAESPARVPHEPPIEVTLTLVVNGNVAAAPLTWVMVTTGAVLSMVIDLAPELPVLFVKGVNTLQNPGDPILIPTHLASNEVDYECELAVVIGRACKNVSRARALDYVLGYTCANDVSARDWQIKKGGGQWCRGKFFDTFCPLGPSLVTTDEITNPNALKIATRLNGQTVQDWTTSDMIFDVPFLVEYFSRFMTLQPGDLILTGTPDGVVDCQPGDVIVTEIDSVGALVNTIAAA